MNYGEFGGQYVPQELKEKLRGNEICLIPQSVNFLDPLMKVSEQAIGECKDENSMNDPIKIRWAKRSIAPQEGTAPITGQFYLRVALGQYTPVLTSAMVMENGSDAVIFASADMVSVQPEMLTMAQEILKKEADLLSFLEKKGFTAYSIIFLFI